MGYGTRISRETVEDLEKIHEVLDAHAPQELRESLARDYPAPPLPGTAAFAAYMVRATRGFAEICEGVVVANKPRPRGRPRKDGEPAATSQDRAMDAATTTEEDQDG